MPGIALKHALRARACVLAASAAFAFCVAPPARGDDFEAEDGPPQDLRIDVTGWVASRCGFVDGEAPGDEGVVNVDLNAAGHIPFRVDCNVPFNVRVTTREGGLRHQGAALTAASARAGYTDLIRYRTHLSVERDGGAPLSDVCWSDTMVLGGFGCGMASGRGLHSSTPAQQRPAYLRVEPDVVDQSRLLAGSYSDIITVEVSP